MGPVEQTQFAAIFHSSPVGLSITRQRDSVFLEVNNSFSGILGYSRDELLGKTAGIDLFRETTRVEHVNRTPEDVERELKAKLSEMMKTIEGSARPALEPGAAMPAAAVKPAPADSSPRADRRRKPAPRS